MDITNWGRWGEDDERGTLNLISPETVERAARLVKTGKTYSLAMPLDATGPQWPLRHRTWRVTTYQSDAVRGGADDVVTMHSHSGTHMDALCHIWYDDKLYNGFDAKSVTSRGTRRNSIDRVERIVGRGVLLDVAKFKGVENLQRGEAITADDLTECAAAQRVEVGDGDLLVIRTGWMRVFEKDRELFDSGEPGLDLSTIPWLHQRDVVAVCADNHGVEVMESIPPEDIPFHRLAIRDLGLYLVENLNLEELAADGVQEFLMVIAPLPLTGAVGSPVNPVAIA